MILLALPAICLIHCAKPAVGTALENATGQDVRIEVTYRGADNRTVAEVVAGGDMRLRTPPDQIDAIHYTYPSHACDPDARSSHRCHSSGQERESRRHTQALRLSHFLIFRSSRHSPG